MNDRRTHLDLLEQVASEKTERDEVRRILGGMADAPRCAGNRCMSGRVACPIPRVCHPPRRLNEAALDRHIRAKHETHSLPELLLESGAMTGPHRLTKPVVRLRARISMWLRDVFVYRAHP